MAKESVGEEDAMARSDSFDSVAHCSSSDASGRPLDSRCSSSDTATDSCSMSRRHSNSTESISSCDAAGSGVRQLCVDSTHWSSSNSQSRSCSMPRHADSTESGSSCDTAASVDSVTRCSSDSSSRSRQHGSSTKRESAVDYAHCSSRSRQHAGSSDSEASASAIGGMAELLSVDQSDGENAMVQWLQALELHVVGACRSDERLRPLLRWNLSCFGADGHFVGRLGLNFKAKEVSMLARCLCAPLVSVRVGTIVSQGHFLRPTNTRGHLDVTMLPSSDLRLSFLEDGGTLEMLALANEESPVELERLVADSSGRSFIVKLPANRSLFFWQSEKSKAAGDELVCKMKDILEGRPSLCQLTGITESRLDSIGSYLRTLFPSVQALSTRTTESIIIPPGSSGLSVSNPLPELSAATQQADVNIVCSETVISSSFPSGLTSGLASSFASLSSEISFATEVEKKALAQRILGSLPQTFVPFPLRVSGSSSSLIPAISPSVPVSSTPLYYCPCPLGNVSGLQLTSLASPSVPSLDGTNIPPIEFGYSLPLVSSSNMPPIEFGYSLPSVSSVLEVYNPTAVVDEEHRWNALINREQAMIEIVPGVLSSNSLSRVISFCPDRVSTSSSIPHSVVSSQAPVPAEIISSQISAVVSSRAGDTQINDLDKRPQ